jgi:nucleotide-binding universal stress UspA family protein
LTAHTTQGAEEKQVNNGASLLREIVEELEIDASFAVHVGNPRKRLVEIATEAQAIVLIVGSSARRHRLGPVARHAAARAPCPVIVVSS